MRVILFLILLLLSFPLFSQIYQTIDKNGNISYSDMPSANAERVVLEPENTVQTNAPAAPVEEKTVIVTTEETKKPYTSFMITSPKDQETIQNQPTITVQLKSDPELQKGDKTILYLDNKPLGTPQEGMQFTLNHIDRGTHQLRASLIDSKGAILKETLTITIFVHYANINFNPALNNNTNTR